MHTAREVDQLLESRRPNAALDWGRQKQWLEAAKVDVALIFGSDDDSEEGQHDWEPVRPG